MLFYYCKINSLFRKSEFKNTTQIAKNANIFKSILYLKLLLFFNIKLVILNN